RSFLSCSSDCACAAPAKATATIKAASKLLYIVFPLFQHIAHQGARADFSAVNDSVLVRDAALGRAGGVRLVDRIRDEIFHRPVLRRTDAHAAAPPIMIA